MKKKRKRNPTGLETGLIAAGAAVVGGIGGFLLASYGCAALIQNSIASGEITLNNNNSQPPANWT